MANYNWQGAPSYGYSTWTDPGAGAQMPANTSGYMQQPYYPSTSVPQQQPYSTAPTPYMVGYPETVQQSAPYQQYTMVQHYSSPIPQPTVPIAHPHQQYPSQEYPTEQYSCNRPVYRPQRNLTVVPVKNDSVKKGVRVDSARADKDYLDAVSNSSLESFDRQDSRSSRDRSPYRDRSYEREDYRDRERKWSLDRDSRDRQRDDRGRRRYSRSPRRDSSHNSDSGMRREKSPSPDSCSDIFKRLEAYKKKFNEIKSSDKPTDDHQKQDKERRISSNQVSGSKSKSRDSEARPQSKDSMPQYKDSRPQYQDSRSQYLDSRPQHKDSRPQHKDAKPQQKDTRPPQKEMRPPQNETKPSQKGASQKEIRPSQNERRPPQKETRPPQKEINKTPQKDTKLSSKTEQKETRPQHKQTAQTRTTRPEQNESKPQQKETKPQQKEAKPPETKEEFLSRKQLELNKKIDSQKAQVTAKRKASTEDTVTSANTSKKTKSDSEENVRTSVKDKTAGNKDQAKVNTNATDSLKKADSKSSSTSSPKKDSDNKFVIPKVPLRNTSSGNSPRKSNSPRAQNTVSPRSTRKSSRIIQQASRNPTVKTDSADSTTDRRRSDRVTDRSPGEGGRDSGGSSDHKKDAESKDGKRKLTDDKRNESHTDEKRRRYDNHASDSYSKTSDNSSKSDNKTKDFKEKNKASSKPNDKNISHKNDKQVSKKDNQSGRESDSKKHDDSSSHKDHSHSNKDSKTSSAAGKSRQVESATKKAVVSKVDRSEIEEVLGMVLDDDEKAETLKTDMITFDDFSDKSLPSGDHPQSEIDSKLKTVVNPVVGLQYVDELIKKQVTFKKSGNFNRYRCKLCIVICDGESLIGHVMGRKHRQSYLKRNWPTNVKDLCKYNIEKSMFAKLHGECSKIEKKFGRQKVRAIEIEGFVGLKKKDSSWQIMIPDEDRRIVSHQGLQVTTIENDGEDAKPQTSDLKNSQSSSDEKALDKSNISKPMDSKSQSSDKLEKTVSTSQSKSPASTSQSNNSVSTSQPSSTFSASQSISTDVSAQSKSQEKQELQPIRTLEPHIQKSLSRAKQVSYKDGKHYVAFYKLIQNKLSVPILGLNYVVELAGYKEGSTAQYLCELCKTPLIDGPQAMFDHIQDQTHQEHYLIQFHGRLAKHFVQMKGEDIRKKIVTNQARVAFAKDGRGQLKYVNMSKPGKKPAEESKADENKAIVEEKPKPVSVPSTEIKVKLFELLEGLKDVPVVGLSYITEIQSRDPATKPRYQCSLCDNIHSTNFINAHLTGLTHRIKFLKTNYPLLHSKVGGDKQMVVKYVKEIEDRYGRESVWVKTLLTTSPNGMPVYSEPIFVKGPYEKKTPEELSPMKQLDQNKPEEKQTSSETTTQATPSDDASVSRGESSGTEFELLIEGLECTPFLGLQYITEIQHPYKIFPAKYECMLCHHIGNGTPLTTSNILNHISSRGHRLNFFRENHEHIYKEIISNKDRQQQTDALTQCTKEIDATIGRGAVSHLVSSDISYWEEEEKQRQKDEKEMEKKKNTAVIDLTQSLSDTQPESVPEQTKPESSTVTPTTEEPIATASGTTTLVEIPKKKEPWRPTRKKPEYFPTLNDKPKVPKTLTMTSEIVRNVLNLHADYSAWYTEWDKLLARIKGGEVIESNMQSRFLTAYDQSFKTFPLMGLQWILEIQRPNLNLEPYYMCRLCMMEVSQKLINAHVNKCRHRIMYMSQYFIDMYHSIRQASFPSMSKLIAKLDKFSEEIQQLENRQHDMLVYLDMDSKKTVQQSTQSSDQTDTRTKYGKLKPLPVPESQMGLLSAVSKKMGSEVESKTLGSTSVVPSAEQHEDRVPGAVKVGIEDIIDISDEEDFDSYTDSQGVNVEIDVAEDNFDKPLTEEELRVIEEEMTRRMEEDEDFMGEFEDKDYEMSKRANKPIDSDCIEVSVTLGTDVFKIANSHEEQPRSSGDIPGLTLLPAEEEQDNTIGKSNETTKKPKVDELDKVAEKRRKDEEEWKDIENSITAKLGAAKAKSLDKPCSNKDNKVENNKSKTETKIPSKMKTDEEKTCASTKSVAVQKSKKPVVVLKRLSKQELKKTMSSASPSQQKRSEKDTSQSKQTKSLVIDDNPTNVVNNENKTKTDMNSTSKSSYKALSKAIATSCSINVDDQQKQTADKSKINPQSDLGKMLKSGVEVSIELKEIPKQEPEVEVSIELNNANEEDEDFQAFIRSQLGEGFVTVDEFEDEQKTEVSISFGDDSKKSPMKKKEKLEVQSKEKSERSKVKKDVEEKIDTKKVNVSSSGKQDVDNKHKPEKVIIPSSIKKHQADKTKPQGASASPIVKKVSNDKPKHGEVIISCNTIKDVKDKSKPKEESSSSRVKKGVEDLSEFRAKESSKSKGNASRIKEEERPENLDSVSNKNNIFSSQTVNETQQNTGVENQVLLAENFISKKNKFSSKTDRNEQDVGIAQSSKKLNTVKQISSCQLASSGQDNNPSAILSAENQKGRIITKKKEDLSDSKPMTEAKETANNDKPLNEESKAMVSQTSKRKADEVKSKSQEDTQIGKNIKVNQKKLSTQELTNVSDSYKVSESEETDDFENLVCVDELEDDDNDEDATAEEDGYENYEEFTTVDELPEDTQIDGDVKQKDKDEIQEQDDNESDDMDFEFTTVDEVDEDKDSESPPVEESEGQDDTLDEFTVIDEVEDDNNDTAQPVQDDLIMNTDTKKSDVGSSGMKKEESKSRADDKKSDVGSSGMNKEESKSRADDKMTTLVSSHTKSTTKAPRETNKEQPERGQEQKKSETVKKQTQSFSAKSGSSCKEGTANEKSGSSSKEGTANVKSGSSSKDGTVSLKSRSSSKEGTASVKSGSSSKEGTASVKSRSSSKEGTASVKFGSSSRDEGNRAKSSTDSRERDSFGSPKHGRPSLSPSSEGHRSPSERGGLHGRSVRPYRGRGKGQFRGRGQYRGRGQFGPYPDRKYSGADRYKGHKTHNQGDDVECQVSVELN